ncbi:hypothetical protein ACFW2V_13255 [Streptomyces sp. NPDC058947]|uniref:hypothetical protein n=1 Tax=Streptomyces sp. NPDC058947 TaxID=3346675 RepID=UPI0036C5047A
MQSGSQDLNNERPNDDPDYQRLIDVTQAIETEIAKVGPTQALDRRFNYTTAFQYGIRRTEETSQEVRLENPDFETLSRLLGAAWPEGFIFGSHAYSQEHRGRKAEAFLDRIALANINHRLSSATKETRSEIFSHAVSTRALGFVSAVRSMRATQVLRAEWPVADHQAIKALVASHWLDGFFVGLVFEELGGHREKQ